MGFVIQGLDPVQFEPLFSKVAAGNGPTLDVVSDHPGWPCRISLDDAPLGSSILLVRYQHAQGQTAYAQSGPVFVTPDHRQAAVYRDQMPPALARRMLSLRAYDTVGAMIDAALLEGHLAPAEISRMFANPAIERIDAHYALRGCFAAHIRRDHLEDERLKLTGG